MFNYIGILHKSSAVTHAVSCNFLDGIDSKLNLVLAKSNIIEIYNITKNGLESTPYLNIYGNIILLESIPSHDNPNHDDIFILTEDLDYSIISSLGNQIAVIAKGTIREDIGKKQDIVLSAMDNKKEIIIISAYKNIFKIINFNAIRTSGTSNNIIREEIVPKELTIRYEYDELMFICPFVDYTPKRDNTYSFGIIKTSLGDDESAMRNIAFETFSVNTLTNELVTYKQQQQMMMSSSAPATNNTNAIGKDGSLCYFDLSLNPTVSLVISTTNGLLILFFANYVTFYTYRNNKLFDSKIKISYSDRKFVAYCVIDEINNKYFTVDENGNLFLLAFKSEKELILQFLGEVNYASCLTYLDANYLFVGSTKGNSQLVKVLMSPKENEPKTPFIDIVEEYESLAPISDFTVVNTSKEENSIEILSVSGTDKNCSIKNIRKGTSLIFDGDISVPGLKNIFKVKYTQNKDKMIIDDDNINHNDNAINCLIVTSTKSYALDVVGSYTLSINNKIQFGNDKCIYANNIQNNGILIVTSMGIVIYNEYFEEENKIKFTNFIPLIVKYHKKTNSLYIYANNKSLIKYNLSNLSNNEVILSNVEISAFDVSIYYILYALWESNDILIYSTQTKKINVICGIDEPDQDIHISSIRIIKKDGNKFFFVSLSNGKMLYYKLKPQFRALNSYTFTHDDFIFKRKYNISTENFEIKKNKNAIDNSSCLFISTPIPSFLYLNKENPVISNFNIKYCKNIINLSSHSNAYVFVFDDHFAFGSLSNTQSQNVLTKKYGHQIYNLSQVLLDKNIPFFTMIIEENNKSSFLLCDINMNEVSKFTFEYDCEICSTFDILKTQTTALFNDRKYFVLGTGIVENVSSEPALGHLYLVELSMDTYKIKSLCEMETKGGVYKVAVSKTNIVFVAIGPSLFIYQIVENTNIFEFKLLRKCVDFTIINDLSFFNDCLVVSDVYRSISLYSYDADKEKLNEICRDYNPVWVYGSAQCNSSMMYIADIDANIISLKKEEHPKSDEEKYKLERKAMFNYGERINKIVSTKLKGKDLKDIAVLDEKTDEVNISYFGTLEGSIGVIIELTKDTYELLSYMQSHILKKVMPNGGFDYNKWRAYKDGFVSEESTGFVEGSILSEFLNFDDNYRKEFLKEINYPWKKNIGDIINIIEALLKYH